MLGAFCVHRRHIPIKDLRPIRQRHRGVATILEQGANTRKPAVGQFGGRNTPLLQLRRHKRSQGIVGQHFEVLRIHPAQFGFIELRGTAP
ncbi:hypothetical protein D3C71_1826660 [compost metagenome]